MYQNDVIMLDVVCPKRREGFLDIIGKMHKLFDIFVSARSWYLS